MFVPLFLEELGWFLRIFLPAAGILGLWLLHGYKENPDEIKPALNLFLPAMGWPCRYDKP